MSVQEMKEKLIEEIQAAEDVGTLQEMFDILQHRQRLLEEEHAGRVHVLSNGQRAAIQHGVDDIAQGRIVSDDEAEADLDSWFEDEEKKWREK